MKEYFDRLYVGSKEEFVGELAENIKLNQKRFIITANPETFMTGKNESRFNTVLKSQKVTIVPDGIGIVKGAGLLGIPVKERITGVELCEELFGILDRFGGSIYLMGASEAVVKALYQKLIVQYPGMKVLGYTNGYADNKDELMEQIAEQKPDAVLIALGVPKQELLISNHYSAFTKGILIGVGGSFDVLSGAKKRAPMIFRKLNMEWLYRITKEPKRIKRFYVSNIKFMKEISRLRARRSTDGKN